jgi:hypothetical protein
MKPIKLTPEQITRKALLEALPNEPAKKARPT